MLLKGHIHIKDEGLLEELETLRYEYDHNQRRIFDEQREDEEARR